MSQVTKQLPNITNARNVVNHDEQAKIDRGKMLQAKEKVAQNKISKQISDVGSEVDDIVEDGADVDQIPLDEKMLGQRQNVILPEERGSNENILGAKQSLVGLVGRSATTDLAPMDINASIEDKNIINQPKATGKQDDVDSDFKHLESLVDYPTDTDKQSTRKAPIGNLSTSDGYTDRKHQGSISKLDRLIEENTYKEKAHRTRIDYHNNYYNSKINALKESVEMKTLKSSLEYEDDIEKARDEKAQIIERGSFGPIRAFFYRLGNTITDAPKNIFKAVNNVWRFALKKLFQLVTAPFIIARIIIVFISATLRLPYTLVRDYKDNKPFLTTFQKDMQFGQKLTKKIQAAFVDGLSYKTPELKIKDIERQVKQYTKKRENVNYVEEHQAQYFKDQVAINTMDKRLVELQYLDKKQAKSKDDVKTKILVGKAKTTIPKVPTYAKVLEEIKQGTQKVKMSTTETIGNNSIHHATQPSTKATIRK